MPCDKIPYTYIVVIVSIVVQLYFEDIPEVMLNKAECLKE